MTRGQGPRDLEERTQRAMIGHAIFRLESALTIALVIILVFFYPQPFHWWKWWYWVVVGLIGEVAIVYTSLTDLRTGKKVVAEMLRQEFNPSEIGVPKYRQRLEKALEYRARIEGTIESREKGVLQDHLHDTLQGVSDWIGNIYRLSKRLAGYEDDALVKRDMQNIPKSLRAYRARLEQETSPDVRRQIEEAIERQEAHRDNLLALQDVMEKAEFQLEATLAALGTVHSQLLLIGAKDIDGARSRQIAQKIRDQVNQLQDILTTMDEVYTHG